MIWLCLILPPLLLALMMSLQLLESRVLGEPDPATATEPDLTQPTTGPAVGSGAARPAWTSTVRPAAAWIAPAPSARSATRRPPAPRPSTAPRPPTPTRPPAALPRAAR